MIKKITTFLLALFLLGCNSKNQPKNEQKSNTLINTELPTYASGFKLEKYTNYSLLHIINPWPEAQSTKTYVLLSKGQTLPELPDLDGIIQVPLQKIVVTSTTHIPALEALGVTSALVGFPGTQYISSVETRKLIDEKKIIDLGKNENINTELLLSVRPEAVIGFGINGDNKTFKTIEKAGIPVVFNGDWTEAHPLGKAEWIKFFGYLFDKEAEANTLFNAIVKEYNEAKQLAQKATNKPTVVSGGMYKDIWYAPYGNSWAGQFISDANATYIWENTEGSGSIAMNLETVLKAAQNADFWITTASNNNKEALLKKNPHYNQFYAFKQNQTYFANTKGAGGGLIFYELGPNRPDLILKDLIKIFHPELLPDYKLHFYNALQ